jgi:hypothetical protein
MADRFKEKHQRASINVISQHEADARAVREKMARLKALRLAHEAANPPASAAAVTNGAPGGAPAIKKKARKSGAKGPSLSDWLATQQKEGRRG